MKRVFSVLTTLVVGCSLVLPVMAGDAGKEVELTGWLADQWCGEKNANAEDASIACARACAEKGSPMVLVADGKTYELSDPKMALEHLGHEVVVKGTLSDKGKIEVKSIEQAKKA
jgi:hypothetical protein